MSSFDLTFVRSQLAAFANKPAPRFVLFKGDWCPDCVRGVPPTRAAIAAAGLALLEINIGAAAEWRSPAHPLRTDPVLKISGIPTLVALTSDGRPGLMLGTELERAPNEAVARKVVEDFISKAKQEFKG